MIDIARIRNLTEFQKVDPGILELTLNSAIADFVRGTRRLWSHQVDYTESQIVDLGIGSLPTMMWFKLYPISSINLVEWDYNETELDSDVIDADEYNLDADGGKIVRDGGFSLPFVKATITGGYTNDQIWTLFPNIVQGIVHEIRYSFKRDNEQNIAITSQGFEKGQTNLRSGLHHPRFDAITKAYRRLI